MTFSNLSDLPHTATATAGDTGKWDTGPLEKGESKDITFTEPGIHYCICTPHPWMYGAVIVEQPERASPQPQRPRHLRSGSDKPPA